MGVTIHFEGRLKAAAEYEAVVATASAFAVQHQLSIEAFNTARKQLKRGTEDGKEWDYDGSTKGIVITLDEAADLVWLEFDDDLYLQDFCKTQFAEIGKHVLLVELLRQLEPHFISLNVFDEGEFWETSDLALLEENRQAFYTALNEAMTNDPELQAGPFKADDGRIIDAMT